MKNAMSNPSPATYITHRSPLSPNSGKSFGIPFSFYAKSYVPNSHIREPETTVFIPGVGSYEVAEKIGTAKLKYSISGKHKDLIASASPSCNKYKPSDKLTRSSKFSETTFGFGKKYDFTQFPTVCSPGPA